MSQIRRSPTTGGDWNRNHPSVEDVVIVAKTRMRNHVCVGGVLENGRLVRLLTPDGENQPENTELKVGHVYRITFDEPPRKIPPHVEDILVSSFNYRYAFSSDRDLVRHLTEDLKIKIWKGSIERVFDGKLEWIHGANGFVSESGAIPQCSVGFWIPDKDLIVEVELVNEGWEQRRRVRYRYPNAWNISIPYVGLQPEVDRIPAGTLVRLSMARWLSLRGRVERRCYLQLSGWYGLSESMAGAEAGEIAM